MRKHVFGTCLSTFKVHDYCPGSIASFFQFCKTDKKHYTLIFSSFNFFPSIFLELPHHQFTPWNTCHDPFRLAKPNKVLGKDMSPFFHLKLMSFLWNHQPWLAVHSWVCMLPLQWFRFKSMKSNFIMAWRVIQSPTSKQLCSNQYPSETTKNHILLLGYFNLDSL